MDYINLNIVKQGIKAIESGNGSSKMIHELADLIMHEEDGYSATAAKAILYSDSREGEPSSQDVRNYIYANVLNLGIAPETRKNSLGFLYVLKRAIERPDLFEQKERDERINGLWTAMRTAPHTNLDSLDEKFTKLLGNFHNLCNAVEKEAHPEYNLN